MTRQNVQLIIDAINREREASQGCSQGFFSAARTAVESLVMSEPSMTLHDLNTAQSSTEISAANTAIFAQAREVIERRALAAAAAENPNPQQ